MTYSTCRYIQQTYMQPEAYSLTHACMYAHAHTHTHTDDALHATKTRFLQPITLLSTQVTAPTWHRLLQSSYTQPFPSSVADYNPRSKHYDPQNSQRHNKGSLPWHILRWTTTTKKAAKSRSNLKDNTAAAALGHKRGGERRKRKKERKKAH